MPKIADNAKDKKLKQRNYQYSIALGDQRCMETYGMLKRFNNKILMHLVRKEKRKNW